MKKIKKQHIYILLFICSVSITGCSGRNSALPLKNIGEVKIGVILPLSGGDVSGKGEEIQQAIMLAVDDFNEVAKIRGMKLKCVYQDNGHDIELSVQAARKLIEWDKVSVILAAVSDLCAFPSAIEANKQKTPVVFSSAGLHGLCEVGGYVFRTCMPYKEESEAIAEYAFRVKGLRKFALVYPDSDYGKNYKEPFEIRIRQLGGSIAGNSSYSLSGTDFTYTITSIKSISPDAVYIVGDGSRINSIAKQMGMQELNVVIMGNSSWHKGNAVVDTTFLEQAIYASGFFLQSDETLNTNFVRKFDSRYYSQPSLIAAQAYDALRVIAHAIYLGGSGRDAVASAMLSIHNFPGVTGAISIMGDGETKKNVTIINVVDSKHIKVR